MPRASAASSAAVRGTKRRTNAVSSRKSKTKKSKTNRKNEKKTPPVFSQIEKFDAEEARRLLRVLPYRHRDLPYLGRLLENGPNGEHKVEYRHAEKLDLGRVYPDVSVAPLTRDSRNRLCHRTKISCCIVTDQCEGAVMKSSKSRSHESTLSSKLRR